MFPELSVHWYCSNSFAENPAFSVFPFFSNPGFVCTTKYLSKTKSNIISSKKSCLFIPDYIIKIYSIFSDFPQSGLCHIPHTVCCPRISKKYSLFHEFAGADSISTSYATHFFKNMGQKSHVGIPQLELPLLCCYSHSSWHSSQCTWAFFHRYWAQFPHRAHTITSRDLMCIYLEASWLKVSN